MSRTSVPGSVREDLRKMVSSTIPWSTLLKSFCGRSQRMSYYNTFTADMELIKLEFPSEAGDFSSSRDDKLQEVMKVNFINAYPISIGQVALNTEQADSFTAFQVQFTYESYNIRG